MKNNKIILIGLILSLILVSSCSKQQRQEITIENKS